MDLFVHANRENGSHQPLAEQLRPKRLEELLGQGKIFDQKAAWRRLIDAGQIPSLILWGPPGTGKTTFALLLAQKVDAEFVQVNAVETGAKTLRELGEQGRRRRLEQRRSTLLFVDEIHRLNKGQQDVLLPFLEKGDLKLVGATTENPSYEINSALLSRCRILVFDRLDREALRALSEKAARSQGCELSQIMDIQSLEAVIDLADGDGRRLLNFIELILKLRSAESEKDSNSDKNKGAAEGDSESDGLLHWPLNLQSLREVLGDQVLRYDKSADQHYDVISAFIKSVRGSDPDAALYYLARMVKGGEDPVFIARRLVILASEDIGNADPRALTLAISGLQAVELVGWPEARISLAQVTTYLASAPKSNRSYVGINKALQVVEETGSLDIPTSLRSSKAKAMKEFGYGKGYKYSHDGEKGYLPQAFLPAELQGQKFYEPTDHGFEKNIRQYLQWLKS